MTGPAPDGWLSAWPVLGIALLVLLGPGTVAVRLVGRSWWTALAAGPAVGVAWLTLMGTVLQIVGLRWTPSSSVASVGALWVTAGGVGVLFRRARRDDAAGGAGGAGARWAVGGAVLAALFGAWPVLAATDGPDVIPQAPDTIFHLGTVMTMMSSGDASTLHATAYVAPGAPSYYPAAFHVVAATVALLAQTQAAVAASTVALVASIVIWPLGVLALARETLGGRPVVLLAAPVAAVTFTAFPTWQLGYGVLWPNLLGQAVLAGTLAVLVGPVLRDRAVVAGVVGLAATAGVALAHPGGLFALALLAGVAALVRVLALVTTSARWLSRAAAAGGTVVVLALLAMGWLVATRASTSMRGSNPRGPEMSWEEGVVDALFVAARDIEPAWLTGGLVVVGAVAVLRPGRPWWLTVAWGATIAMYLAVVAVDSYWTRLVTWPWYNNSPRLAALIVIPASVLLVAALALFADLVARFGERGAAGQPPTVTADTSGEVRHRFADRPWVVVALVGLFLAATVGANVPQRTAVLDRTFHPPAASSWVTDEELAALRTLGASLPAGAVVAANPFRGGQYLFPVSERRLLYPSEKVVSSSPELVLLGRSLDRAGTDPAVCSALRARGVEWAITGGEVAVRARSAVTTYAGVDAVGTSDAWEAVRSVGPYTLYHLVACASG